MAATKLASKTRIYLDVKAMLDITIGVVRNFPKSQRPIFGDRLCNLLIDALQRIARAYMLRDLRVRIEHLTQLQADLEIVGTLINIAGEQRWIMGSNRLVNLLRLHESVGKQCTAWKGSLQKALASEAVPDLNRQNAKDATC